MRSPTSAWTGRRRRADPVSVRRAALVATIAALAAVVILTLVGWPASIYRHGAADMPQFWLAPRTLIEGTDPYAVWDWPYPLWTAVALLPMGLLPLEVAAPTWLVLQVVVVAAVLAAIARRALLVETRRDALVLAAIAVSMQPTWLLVGGGNMTGLLFSAFGGALLAVLAGRPLLGGALLGLVVTKPLSFVVAGPALILATNAAERVRVLAGAALSAGTLVAASFLLRPGWPQAWIPNAIALQTSAGSNATGWTVGRSAPGILPDWLISTGSIALALIALAVWWRLRRPDPLLLVAGAVPVSLYVAPHGWSYDQLLLLITYAVVLGRLALLRPSERVSGLIAVALIAVAIPWTLYAIAVATGSEERSAVVPLLAFALLVGADHRAVRRAPSSRVALGARRPLASG